MEKRKIMIPLMMLLILCCIVTAFADSGTVKVEAIPNKTEIDPGSGAATVTYTVRVTPPENGHIGAMQFKLTAPDGAALAQTAGTDGWKINSSELRYVAGIYDGCFAMASYTPESGIFLAAGTTDKRNMDKPIDVMTITMTIDDASKAGDYAPIVTEAVASEWDVANSHEVQTVVTSVTVGKETTGTSGTIGSDGEDPVTSVTTTQTQATTNKKPDAEQLVPEQQKPGASEEADAEAQAPSTDMVEAPGDAPAAGEKIGKNGTSGTILVLAAAVLVCVCVVVVLRRRRR